MALKPTYEELHQKVKMLEGEVSDLKKVEAARLDIEKQLVDIQRIACTGIWVWDLRTGKVEWSHEVFKIFGLDPKRFKPDIDSIMSRFSKDEQELHDKLIKIALENNEQYSFEASIVLSDGKVRHLTSTSEGKFDNQGGLIQIFGIVKDITDHKEVEERLRKSEAKFRDLIENINDVIYSTNENGEIIYISPSIKGVMGYDPSEIIGNNFSKYIHPEDLPFVIERFSSILSGEQRPSEYRILAKSGVYHWIRSSSKPIYGDDQLVGLTGVFADITEQKRLESELVQAQKMESIGTLAGGIAHDFNNILSAVIGFTELAQTEAEKGTRLYDDLQEVLLAGGRAKDLVKQILTFSRQAEQEPKPVQVKRIAQEALKFLRASLPTSIEIRQDIRSDSLVMADPTQIHQVLMNLCTNAEHAMRKKGGILKVMLTDAKLDTGFITEHPELQPGPYLELTVSDTGNGMSSKIQDRIFDPFFTTKDKGEGTGMGLAVVHGIVGTYGGTITVTSKQGQGTNFKIYFPVVERLLETQPKDEEVLLTGSEHILFVDDEPALADLGKQTLSSLGYKVTTRTSSLEALELFKAKSDRFDLVITDMTMPNMTGDDLAKEMKLISPKTPVILCTGYSARINKKQAIAMGIQAYVTKPVLRKIIAKTIRNVLDDK